MSDRLKSLRRIEAVQKKMLDLSTWRLTEATRLCGALEADQKTLRDFMIADDPIGAPLAKAALRAVAAIETRRARAEHLRSEFAAQRVARETRSHVVAAMVAKAEVAARRDGEDRDLASIMEAWLAAEDASLP